jgi:glycosyltransferase involved in cell wall biosynthesis
MKNIQPVFLFPRNSASKESLVTLLNRLDFYGCYWSEDNSTKILVFLQKSKTLEDLIQIKNYEHLEIIFLTRSVPLNVIFPLFSNTFLKATDKSTMLICGDLFVAPFMARLAQLKARNACRIQISFHGNPIGSERNFSRMLKKFMLGKAINFSDSIRLVSNHVGDEILPLKHRIGKNIFVAPIPTEVPIKLLGRSEKTLLAFVGRLQNERNPHDWCQLANRFLEESPNSQAIVIGGGPLRQDMESYFHPSVSQRIEFVGEVEKGELNHYWPNISILLSTAPSEGFGLSIREALIRGVYVVAKENVGTLQIANEFSGIFTYRSMEEGFRLINDLSRKHFDENDCIANRKRVLAENESSINNLMKSWQLVY